MKSSKKKIKVVVAMPGLDCHDRGIVYLSHVLREAGMEVVYLGKFNTPEHIVNTAIEEDADVIALSYLNDHLYMTFFPKVVELLREKRISYLNSGDGGQSTLKDGWRKKNRVPTSTSITSKLSRS